MAGENYGFQSTHSLRSATASAGCCVGGVKFQSTHSLRSATNGRATSPLTLTGFNPRTPCGVRPCSSDVLGGYLKFQSTHSLRSATRTWPRLVKNVAVSIHALLAECDRAILRVWPLPGGFNPRTPCGVRPSVCSPDSRPVVSIHALLAECDHFRTFPHASAGSFNPRTPCGVRPTNLRAN